MVNHLSKLDKGRLKSSPFLSVILVQVRRWALSVTIEEHQWQQQEKEDNQEETLLEKLERTKYLLREEVPPKKWLAVPVLDSKPLVVSLINQLMRHFSTYFLKQLALIILELATAGLSQESLQEKLLQSWSGYSDRQARWSSSETATRPSHSTQQCHQWRSTSVLH